MGVEKMGPVVSLSAKLDCHSVATCRLRLTKWITALIPASATTLGLCGAHECKLNYWEDFLFCSHKFAKICSTYFDPIIYRLSIDE